AVLPQGAAHIEPPRQVAQPGDGAQQGRLAATGRPEQGGDALHGGLKRNIQRKAAQRGLEGGVDTAHPALRRIRRSSTVMERMTMNENTSIPPARICAEVKSSVST